MTDLDVVLTEIQSLKHTQDKHGTALERLADAYSRMAVQSEQITSLQAQCATLFNKHDELVGPAGIVTRVLEHQGRCPKEEMHRTFKWMWAAIGVHSVALLAILAAVLKVGT